MKLVAPNGKPSNLTPEQYKLVRTKAFKDWFGDWENDPANASKVVDENGEPMICYHATDKGNIINEFYKRRAGIHFGTKKAAIQRREQTDFDGDGYDLLEVFLKIKNPLIVNRDFNWEWEEMEYVEDFDIKKYDDYNLFETYAYKLGFNIFSIYGLLTIEEILLENKFDGIFYKNQKEDKGSTSYLMINSNQIKLADGSNTTFDGSNPDIRFMGGGSLSDEKYTLFREEFFTHFISGKLGNIKGFSEKNGNKDINDLSEELSLLNQQNKAYQKGRDIIDKLYFLAKKIDENTGLKTSKGITYNYIIKRDIFSIKEMYDKIDEEALPIFNKKNTNTTFDGSNTDIRYAGGGAINQYLIVVDIQPEYENYINDNNSSFMDDFVDYVNNTDKSVVFLYNGQDTLGMVSEYDYKNWLIDKGVLEEVVNSATFYDKGYAFFRYCMDEGINEDDIVSLVKMMYEKGINDSRELDDDFWIEYIENNGSENLRDMLNQSDDCIYIPDLMDFLKKYNGITICGGGINECLKEVEIALKALGKKYRVLDEYTYEKGGRTIAQTPAPKKDRVYGSKKNKPKSAESRSKASSIILNPKTISSIKSKIEIHNDKFPKKKIPLSTAKAVVRRGMGAYSSSHRPTIRGGKPNSRVAWGLARLNAFIYKIQKGYSKSGKYTQDDDLINELGYRVKKYEAGGRTFNDKELLAKYKRGESIGFTGIAHLKAKGLIKRADGSIRKSDKYKYSEGGNLGKHTLKEVYPSIFLLQMDSQSDLANTFARCQAFYEWDAFKGKKFNIQEFHDWYGINHPDLKPYEEEFYGFNLPSDAIYNCYKVNNERNEYDNFFLHIIEKIKKATDKFYLIGVVYGDDRTLDHELAHAFFWKDENYKNDMTNLVNSIPNKDDLLRILNEERGYGKAVLIDEAQAFLSAGLIVNISDWENYRKPFIERFERQKNTFENGGLLPNIKVEVANQKQSDDLYNLLNESTELGSTGEARLVLLEKDKVIGGIFLDKYSLPYEYMFDIYIKKSKRGKGYSKFLLDAMIKDFLENFPEADQIRSWVINKKLETYLEEKYDFGCDDGNEENIMYCYLSRKDAKKIKFETGGTVEPKKVYVSIRIPKETGKVSEKEFYTYEVKSYNPVPFEELKNQKMVGIRGVSTSNWNINQWLVHRDCLILMPFKEFVELNNEEQIQYDDANYLTKNGLEIFYRLYDHKVDLVQTTIIKYDDYEGILGKIFPKISLEFALESKVKTGSKSASLDTIRLLFDVYYSGAFKRWIAKQKHINSVSDFADLVYEYLESDDFNSNYYSWRIDKDSITKEDLYQPIERGILYSAGIYKNESEWILKDKTLNIPIGSQLFFVIGGYENTKEKLMEMIKIYGLDKIYKINFINQKNLDRLQSKRFSEESDIYKQQFESSKIGVENQLKRLYLKSMNEVVEDLSNKWIKELNNSSINGFHDDISNDQKKIEELPEFIKIHDEVLSKFIEMYQAELPNFIKYKNKYLFSQLMESFRNWLKDYRREKELTYDPTISNFYNYLGVYELVSPLNSIILDYDYNQISKNIKEQAGANLYRYYKEDEILLKKGGQL